MSRCSEFALWSTFSCGARALIGLYFLVGSTYSAGAQSTVLDQKGTYDFLVDCDSQCSTEQFATTGDRLRIAITSEAVMLSMRAGSAWGSLMTSYEPLQHFGPPNGCYILANHDREPQRVGLIRWFSIPDDTAFVLELDRDTDTGHRMTITFHNDGRADGVIRSFGSAAPKRRPIARVSGSHTESVDVNECGRAASWLASKGG
jgi:hypothetical protein